MTVSAAIKQNDQEVEEYRNILDHLELGMFSQPFAHKSRVNTVPHPSSEKVPGGVPLYNEMAPILKDKLIDQAVDQETDLYLLKLRQHGTIISIKTMLMTISLPMINLFTP